MVEISTYDRISEIDSSLWQRLNRSDYPFTQYAFLDALERSGSVSEETGWKPIHLVIRSSSDDGQVILPTYLKSHSYGEYVFDWSWARAYQENGLDYYPKLLSAIPFTPCTGPRWLSNLRTDQTIELIDTAIDTLMDKLQVESWHLLFSDLEESQRQNGSWRERQDIQYHWYNRNYRDFDHYLEHFTARKRKDVRKDRARVDAAGIDFSWVTGSELGPEHLEIFYPFYAATYLKRGRPPYLNRSFFRQIFEQLSDQLLLVIAEKKDQPVAAALSFKDHATLYGRYWGCLEEYDSLHFETCYYQGIEYCIHNGLAHFDSGAQGEHKIKRGFEPILTRSYHRIRHPEFDRAIRQFLDDETRVIHHHRERLSDSLPFKSIS